MENPKKIKRKRIAVKVLPENDGLHTPVADSHNPVKLTGNEAALYKQANNPLGDPNRI